MVRTTRATIATGTTLGGNSRGTMAAGSSKSTVAGSANAGQASGGLQEVGETPGVDVADTADGAHGTVDLDQVPWHAAGHVVSDAENTDVEMEDSQETGQEVDLGRMAERQNSPSGDPSKSDPSESEPSYHPSTSVAPPVPPPDDASSDSTGDEHVLQQIRKLKRRALCKAELEEFREQAKRGFEGFVEVEHTGIKRPRLDMEQLALEQARGVTRPDPYGGKSQEHLDKFLMQVDMAFRMQPTVYRTDEGKCTYAGNALTDRPALKWDTMNKAIRANPSRTYSWSEFAEMLQEDLIHEAQHRVKVMEKLKALRQLPNQSVANFLSYFQSLEQQLENDLSDDMGYFFVLTGVHEHLKEALIRYDHLGTTRSELERALCMIEYTAAAPAGITTRRSGGAARKAKPSNSSIKAKRPCSKKNASQQGEVSPR